MRSSGSERAKEEKNVHPIPPLYRADSEILILGSFPSVKSRESAFFYGHPQNRFWKVMDEVFEDEVPRDVPERRSFLIRHKVAAWDVIHSCTIRQIYVNGRTAEKMYKKYIEPSIGRKAVCLPSTSPANAAWSLERLVGAWKAVRE